MAMRPLVAQSGLHEGLSTRRFLSASSVSFDGTSARATAGEIPTSASTSPAATAGPQPFGSLFAVSGKSRAKTTRSKSARRIASAKPSRGPSKYK
jgi:hypothetical protein